MTNRWLAALFIAAGAAQAAAHPHISTEMQSELVLAEDGKITGVRVRWTPDQNYSVEALDGLDVNGNGTYEAEELARLTAENLEALADYDYFVHVRLNGDKQKTGKATDGSQTYDPADGRLTLRFTVPLQAPADPRAGEVQLKIYDPDYFIDFTYVRKRPFLVSRPLPPGCTGVLMPPPGDDALDQTRQMLSTKDKDWKPEADEDFGGMFAQAAIISCAKS